MTPASHPAVSALLLALLLCLAPAGAGAEIYRWTDASGRVHFTQDLSQVPAAHRAAAEAAAKEPPSDRLQIYSTPASQGAGGMRASIRRSGRPLAIPFERRGNAMLVYVRLNDRVTAPFLVDTGASDVAIPAAVAQQAGIAWGPDSPHATYQTANGLVRKPIVEVDSVQVGDARLEHLRGSISTSMSIGLLGGAFFNNFTFQIDPAAQVITLVPNPSVRSGMTADGWRQRFGDLRAKIEAVDRYLTERHLIDRGRIRELEGRREDLRGKLEDLEREANRAGVPRAWRY